MTMRFIPTTPIISGTDSSPLTVFAWIDFMRTSSPGGPGWTIPRSSDGTTGGAGDNIAAFADLKQYNAGVSQSWFVLRSPDGSKEFMWARFNTDLKDWQVRYSPTAIFIGGDETSIPTAADTEFYHQVRSGTTDLSVMHMGADDTAPYGFFMFSHRSGTFALVTGVWVYIPVTATPAGDIDPYVYYMADINFGGDLLFPDLYDENNNADRSRCVAIMPGAPSGEARTCPANVYQNTGGVMIPNKIPLDDNNDDVSFPILFGRSTDEPGSGYKGISTFMQWNGFTRAVGETFASRTRVSWGDVNLPWDGSTPLPA